MTQAFNLSQFANKVNSSGQADLTTAVTGLLPVANGGSGTSTPSLVAGSGVSVSGSWPNQTISSASSYAGDRGQVFASNGTFTIPAGVTAVKVIVTGGGAGGQFPSAPCGGGANLGNGGGAGATAMSYLTGLTPGATLAVVIGGAGGAGGSGGANGGAGGNSTVASGTQTISTITGGGGTGGGAGTNGTGNGGTASGGTINTRGGSSNGGGGGASFYGGGNFGGYGSSDSGGAIGSGGNGGFNSGSGNAGTAGKAGLVVFEW